jgi:hypothetical protein
MHAGCYCKKNSSTENEIDIETTVDFSSSIHEVFEEYEWADQKRIRTVTLLNDPVQGVNIWLITTE